MFERESKREKILEARNREIKLKQKQKSAGHIPDEAVEDEEEPVGSGEIDDAMLQDSNVRQAEADFYAVIQQETAEPLDVVEEEATEVLSTEEGVTDIESPTEASEPVQEEKKEKKKRKGGKKKREKK